MVSSGDFTSTCRLTSAFRHSSAAHLDDLERFTELKWLSFGELLRAVAHAGLQLLAGAHLRDVGEQGVDLAIERFGNVDDLVGVFWTEEPDFGRLVRFETLLEMLWEI